MNPIKTTLLTLSLLTASIGAQAAELPQSAILQYSGSYGIPASNARSWVCRPVKEGRMDG